MAISRDRRSQFMACMAHDSPDQSYGERMPAIRLFLGRKLKLVWKLLGSNEMLRMKSFLGMQRRDAWHLNILRHFVSAMICRSLGRYGSRAEHIVAVPRSHFGSPWKSEGVLITTSIIFYGSTNEIRWTVDSVQGGAVQ